MYQPKNLITCIWLAIFIAATACNQQSSDIEIKGHLTGVEDGWVYLNNVFPDGSKPFDSTKVLNGAFSFTFHSDTLFEPRLVYITGKENSGKKYDLPINDPHKANHRYGGFIMETGLTELTGDVSKNSGMTLKAGKQNNFFFKNPDLPYIRISRDTNRRNQQFARFLNKIKETPDAFFAMYAMSNWKFSFSKSQLNQLYNAFDQGTKDSYSGKQIKEFLDFKLADADLMPNNTLVNDRLQRVMMLDSGKKLNMVIFWASWCGPCRAEIPALKNVAKEITDSRLRMVSISVDDDEQRWRKALKEESMPWEQLLITPDQSDKLTAQYNLDAIPQIYFIDNKRNLVAKLTGFEPNNEKVFKKIINDFLNP
jgi:thiol-disulfide isomerase/thioredoxin